MPLLTIEKASDAGTHAALEAHHAQSALFTHAEHEGRTPQFVETAARERGRGWRTGLG